MRLKVKLKNYIYLSNSDNLVESRKPLAKGLLSIFNFVICRRENAVHNSDSMNKGEIDNK